jgi:tetratricopeptide (TPR) repeat protein
MLLAQGSPVDQTSSPRRHDDPQWLLVKDHLPDPATATAKRLEDQADLLRVRRFPEDALEFYGYAIKRGGNTANLMNKIGLTQLELHNVVLAEGYFRQAVKMDRRSAQGWNNLAATEYLQRQYGSAVGDYKKAVKLDGATAVFHANLSTAYFETKDYKRARRQADDAMKIDPNVYQHSSGAGVAAHPLAVEDRARFSFEMAKLYAEHGHIEEMLHALSVASENGFDIGSNMMKDPDLAKYNDDPRVSLLIMTAKALHQAPVKVMASATAPRLDAVPTSH